MKTLRIVLALVLLVGAAPTSFPQQVTEKRVTLNFKEVPLRGALELLFQGTGFQYAVKPEGANPPVTLAVKDQPFEAALRLLLDTASPLGAPRLRFTREGAAYVIHADGRGRPLPGGLAVPGPPGVNRALPAGRGVSVRFEALPFRKAIEALFQGTGYQYAIAPAVPDPVITLNLRDQPFPIALRTLLRLASGQATSPITMSEQAGIYVIDVAAPGTVPGVARGREIDTLKIHVANVSVTDLLEQMARFPQALSPEVNILSSSGRDNSLVVRGPVESLADFRRFVTLVDVPAPLLDVTVGITGPGVSGKPFQLRSTVRSVTAAPITLEDQAPLNGRTARLKVQLDPVAAGQHMVVVRGQWEVEVPVAGGARGAAMLVKRFTADTRVRPNEEETVAEVDAAGWGGKGTVRFWVKVAPVQQGRAVVEPAGDP